MIQLSALILALMYIILPSSVMFSCWFISQLVNAKSVFFIYIFYGGMMILSRGGQTAAPVKFVNTACQT